MPLSGIEHVHTADEQAIAITALVRRGDTLWCGLTAGRYALVPFDLRSRRFGEPVDIFPWVDQRPQTVLSKIHNGMGLLDDGRLVIGEGILFSWDGLPFEMAGEESTARRAGVGLPPMRRERVGPRCLAEFDMRAMTGGRILLYDPDGRQVTPVGTVQPFNYVQSLAVDPVRHKAYGHTLGDGHFFAADLDARTVEDHGRISLFSFHNLCVLPGGVVYGSWVDMDQEEALRVLRFDPAKGYVERRPECYLPAAGPRVQGNRGIDQWLVHSDGSIYVGMAGDGVLYRFDPRKLSSRNPHPRTSEVSPGCGELTTTPIGRIGEGGRVTSLVEDERGRVIFTGGFPRMHVGRFDPATGQIEDFGPVSDRYAKIYFHGCAYAAGTLWLAETDSGVASLWEVPLPK